MEIIVVLLLLVVNGVFAMAEIAIVSARKSKLEQEANDGNKNAQIALELAKSPNRFLSTVQIGITLIGIVAGVFGGTALSADLARDLSAIPFISAYSEAIAILIIVSLITYLTLVIGELVPKRIALHSPEKIAILVAQPMHKLSIISGPLVSLLSVSTDRLLRLFNIKAPLPSVVTDEEVKLLLREGIQTGVFEVTEKDIVERTLRLSDRKVNTLMSPRKEIVWLDIDSSFTSIRNTMVKTPHSHFPICRGSLDNTLGIVHTEGLLQDFLALEKIDLKKNMHRPLFIPESMEGLKVLELFKKSGIHMALVVDEYGIVQGLLSLTDILEAIVGDIVTVDQIEERQIVKRSDGSFLVDGLVSIDEFKDHFQIKKLPGEKNGTYHTVGGFVMNNLDKIPTTSDSFELVSFRFEVIDMDGNRVDKVLITPL